MIDPDKDISEIQRWEQGIKNEIEKKYNEDIPNPDTCRYALKIIDFFKKIGGELHYARATADLTIGISIKIFGKVMRLECDDEGCGVGIDGDKNSSGNSIFYDLILK